MNSETQKTPLPNGNADLVEEATIAVRVGRLEHQVEKGFGVLNTKIDKLSLSDADQTGQLATLEQRTKWREVAAKTVAGIVGAAVVTTQPEVRDALKAAWQIVSKLLGIAALVCLASLNSGCAHYKGVGIEIFGAAMKGAKDTALTACQAPKDQGSRDKCSLKAIGDFEQIESIYSQVKAANEGLEKACGYRSLAPKEIQHVLNLVCELCLALSNPTPDKDTSHTVGLENIRI